MRLFQAPLRIHAQSVCSWQKHRLIQLGEKSDTVRKSRIWSVYKNKTKPVQTWVGGWVGNHFTEDYQPSEAQEKNYRNKTSIFPNRGELETPICQNVCSLSIFPRAFVSRSFQTSRFTTAGENASVLKSTKYFWGYHIKKLQTSWTEMELILNVSGMTSQDRTDKDTAATLGLLTALYPPGEVYNLRSQPADGTI